MNFHIKKLFIAVHMSNMYVYRIAKTAVTGLIVLCLTACHPQPDNDIEIGEITILNIPARIPVHNSDPVVYNDTYKVYVNASDFEDDIMPPAAQGFIIVTPDMLQQNGTYLVTIPLSKPIINLKPINGEPNPHNPPGHVYDPNIDPNNDLGPWKGTAKNFSVTISPKDVTEGVETVWMKGSVTFDRSRTRVNWERGFMDFRDPSVIEMLGEKTPSFYNDLILRDPDITRP